MRVLAILTSLIILIGCSSELDRCVEANIEKIVNFEDKFLNYYWPEERKLIIKYNDAYESSNGDKTKYQDEMDAIIDFLTKFERSLTETEKSIWDKFQDRLQNGAGFETDKQVIKFVKSQQAKAVKDASNEANNLCNLQGIY